MVFSRNFLPEKELLYNHELAQGVLTTTDCVIHTFLPNQKNALNPRATILYVYRDLRVTSGKVQKVYVCAIKI